jgi:hypothetical protein
VLFKVHNENEAGAVVGLFNARFRETDNVIEGNVSPSDVPSLGEGEYAVYLHRKRTIARVARADRIPVSLDTHGWEIAAIAPLERGVAAMGLGDKLNGGGAILKREWSGSRYRVELRDGGELVLYSDHRPISALVDGEPTDFELEGGRLLVKVPQKGHSVVEIAFADREMGSR